MKKIVRFIAQYIDADSGGLIEESIIKEEALSKAGTLKELGYTHIEQIDFLQKVQDFKIKHQIILNTVTTCPTCACKTKKVGVFKSKFHAVLTDHRVGIQRTHCNCGWYSKTSVEGVFGSNIHPDLLKKQALQGSKESYQKSSVSLNAESANQRPVNGHSQISRVVKSVGEKLEQVKKSIKPVNKILSPVLVVNIDGGHIKARGDNRSFEAMIATIYQPKNLKIVDRNHNSLEAKTIVASAKSDDQVTMKALFKNACMTEGMGGNTEIICLADGAKNCKSIAYSITKDCKSMTYILDWFHIAMKFQNISIPEIGKKLLESAKWNLWHGNCDKALERLQELMEIKTITEDRSLSMKLSKLSKYISNNNGGIVNYEERKNKRLVFTSNLAESMVNTLINERQKGKQKMLWGREGAHNVLQIRAAQRSKSWLKDWESVEAIVYKLAA
jgi:phage pi2 protein 07